MLPSFSASSSPRRQKDPSKRREVRELVNATARRDVAQEIDLRSTHFSEETCLATAGN